MLLQTMVTNMQKTASDREYLMEKNIRMHLDLLVIELVLQYYIIPFSSIGISNVSFTVVVSLTLTSSSVVSSKAK
jgi:hypothetical protein